MITNYVYYLHDLRVNKIQFKKTCLLFIKHCKQFYKDYNFFLE